MTVNEYIESFSGLHKDKLRAIHSLILLHFEGVEYKINYKIIEYKMNNHKVYVGAFNKHIGIYTGKDEVLAINLSHIKSKNGTFYLPIDKDLPFDEILHIFNYQLKK